MIRVFSILVQETKSPLSAWSAAPGSCLVLCLACSPVLSPWLHAAPSSWPPHGRSSASRPEAPTSTGEDELGTKHLSYHELHQVEHGNPDLAELFDFVLGDGRLLLQSCKKSLSFLCSWVRPGCRLAVETRHINKACKASPTTTTRSPAKCK